MGSNTLFTFTSYITHHTSHYSRDDTHGSFYFKIANAKIISQCSIPMLRLAGHVQPPDADYVEWVSDPVSCLFRGSSPFFPERFRFSVYECF